MILPFALLLAVGTLVAVLDRRVRSAERFARRLDRGVVTGFGLALALTALIAVGAVGHPLRHVENAWHSFSTGAKSSSRLESFHLLLRDEPLRLLAGLI